ncbi:MAG: hypothetical protein IJV56_02105, partial [Neisseriaceae bacterium]|nr:hypothetical protein [Neisseriaceae bacterium]
NRALKDYHPSSIRGALESPRMKDEWLQVVIDKHPKAEIQQAAQRVLAERQALSSPTLSDNLEPENHTANKGGFYSPEHEEELATIADDDDYGRD